MENVTLVETITSGCNDGIMVNSQSILVYNWLLKTVTGGATKLCAATRETKTLVLIFSKLIDAVTKLIVSSKRNDAQLPL